MNFLPGLLIMGILIIGVAIIALSTPRRPKPDDAFTKHESKEDKDNINKGLPNVKNTPSRWK